MLFWACAASLAGAVPAFSQVSATEAVVLEIIDGETAFRVDEKTNKAWWIVGECQRPIPMEMSKLSSQSSDKKSNQSNVLLSKVISDDVRMGSRQIALRQQFRFNLANTSATVDVFNSVRGGWSQVPVRVIDACSTKPTCRALAELPEC